MFKYVKYNKVKTEYTVLEFRGGDDTVKVNHFDGDVVSISGDSSDIDALMALQPDEIECVEISQEEFRVLVGQSAQLKRIRDVVKGKIADRYDAGDEIAMSRRTSDDPKRVEYDAYVAECIAYGNELKTAIGYN